MLCTDIYSKTNYSQKIKTTNTPSNHITKISDLYDETI